MKIIRLNWILMISLFIGIYSVVVQAKRITQIDRYMVVLNQPLYAQEKPLEQILQIHFPINVNTINQAIWYLLMHSGYNLASIKKQSKTVREMLDLPLPLVDRRLGPITLRAALEVLAGHAFKLAVDPVHRVISFKLKEEYKRYE